MSQQIESNVELPFPAPLNHGNTSAAWTLVVFVLVGMIAAAVGMVIGMTILIWAGIGVCVLGCVVGGVLKAVGRGQQRVDPLAD